MRREKKKSKKQLEAKKKAPELREKMVMRREFIQYLYAEKLKEDAQPKQLILKDKIIWYAEPGTAEAPDSFDHKRYEMVCVRCCCSTPSYSPSSSFVMGPLVRRTSATQSLPMSYF